MYQGVAVRVEAIYEELRQLNERLRVAEHALGLVSPPATSLPATTAGAGVSNAEALLLNRQLRALAARVQAVEAALSARVMMERATTEPAPSPQPVEPGPTTYQPVIVDMPPTPAPVEAVTVSSVQAPEAAVPTTADRVTSVAERAEALRRYLPRSARPARAKKPAEPFNLERLIGGRWFAWIGALAVVVGVGLLLKLAYEQHWFRVSPALRCIMGAAFGFMMVVIGEVVRKKVTIHAAAGILAAGIGTIYASAFGAYRLYDLVSDPVGVAMLAATAAFGIAVGVRARLASVTAVSLIGGYLAPFLIPGTSNPVVLPVFLLMLMSVGLVVGTVMGGLFSVLRTLVWWATMLIGGWWAWQTGVLHPTTSLPFLGLVWLGVQFQLGWTARRAVTPQPETTERPDWLTGDVKALARSTGTPIPTSLSTSAWATVLAVVTLDHAHVPSWWAAAVLAAACVLASWWVCGTFAILRQPARALGAALLVQAAGLVAVAGALAFSGRAEVICGTILALAAFALSRTLLARPVAVYGLCVLALTSLRVLVYDSWASGMTEPGHEWFGLVLSEWTAVTAWVGAAWMLGAWLLRPFTGAYWRSVCNAMVGVGILLFGVALVNVDAERWTFPVIAGTTAVALAAAGWTRRSKGLAWFAGAVQVVGLALLIPTRWWSVTTPHGVDVLGLHLEPVAWSLPYLGLTALGVSLLSRRSTDTANVRNTSDWGVVALVTLLGAALLHTRAADYAMASVVFATGVVSCLIAGWRRSQGILAAGVLYLALGTIAVGLCAWWVQPAWTVLAGITVTQAAVVALLGGAAWVMCGVMALRIPMAQQASAARLSVGVGLALAMVAFVHRDTSMGAICIAWLALAMVTGAARNLRPVLALELFNLMLLVPATVMWVPAYGLRWTPSAAPFVLHPGLGVAGLLAAAWWVALQWYQRMPARRVEAVKAVRSIAVGAISLLLFAATSLEVARIAAGVTAEPTVRGAVVSIWWGVLAIGLIAAGFAKRISLARWAGLGILGTAMFKAVFIDLQHVPQLWRIASFIGLGLMMLVVPIAYSKMSFLFDRPAGGEPAEPKAGTP